MYAMELVSGILYCAMYRICFSRKTRMWQPNSCFICLMNSVSICWVSRDRRVKCGCFSVFQFCLIFALFPCSPFPKSSNDGGMVDIGIYGFFWFVKIMLYVALRNMVLFLFLFSLFTFLYVDAKKLDCGWKPLYCSSFLHFSLLINQILNTYMQKSHVTKIMNNAQYILA
jgi:hypothetical protein